MTAQQSGTHGGHGKAVRLPRTALDAVEAEMGLSRRASLTPTLSSDRSSRVEGAHAKHMREMGESDVRDNLIAWKLPNGVAS